MDGLDSRFDAIDAGLTGLEGVEERFETLEALGSRLEELKARFASLDGLEQDISDLKMTIENETNKNIVRIAKSHLDLICKLDDTLKAESETEMLAIHVNILENELRKVKEKLKQTGLSG